MTTFGIAGHDENGDPRFVDQSYDNAVKIVSDRSETTMAMIAGYANIGQESAMDFFMSKDLRQLVTGKDQDERLSALIKSMVDEKKKFWQGVQAPGRNRAAFYLEMLYVAARIDVMVLQTAGKEGPSSIKSGL